MDGTESVVARGRLGAEQGVRAVREGLGGARSSQAVAVLWRTAALRSELLKPLQPAGVTLLLKALNPLQLQVKQEPLPPEMLLLRWTGTKDALWSEIVNANATQPEEPTHARTDQ